MNANELAEAMEIRAAIRRQVTSRKSVQEGANDRLADQLDQAATMLRQQQEKLTKYELRHAEQRKRIEELEAELKLIDELVRVNKINTEPVAWWCGKEYADSDMEGGHVEELEFNQPSIHDPEGLIWEKPLYTHPAKTLTDGEMLDCLRMVNFEAQRLSRGLKLFAEAILRKAQEK